MDIGGAQLVNVDRLANAIREGSPIEKLLPSDVKAAVKKVANDGLDTKEYQEFKRIVGDNNKSIRAGRFAKNVSGFLGKPGDKGKIAAFVILGLVRSGRKDVAAKLLKRVVDDVFPKFECQFSKAPSARE